MLLRMRTGLLEGRKGRAKGIRAWKVNEASVEGVCFGSFMYPLVLLRNGNSGRESFSVG